MTSLRYYDLTPRRLALAQNLLNAALQRGLTLEDKGDWLQLRSANGPHVMLAIHEADKHPQAREALLGVMRQVDTLCDEPQASLADLVQSLHEVLGTYPRHHIQL